MAKRGHRSGHNSDHTHTVTVHVHNIPKPFWMSVSGSPHSHLVLDKNGNATWTDSNSKNGLQKLKERYEK